MGPYGPALHKEASTSTSRAVRRPPPPSASLVLFVKLCGALSPLRDRHLGQLAPAPVPFPPPPLLLLRSVRARGVWSTRRCGGAAAAL